MAFRLCLHEIVSGTDVRFMNEVVEDHRSRRAPGMAPDSVYHTNSAAGPDLCTSLSQRSH